MITPLTHSDHTDVWRFFNKAPLLKTLPAFCIGIILQYHHPASLTNILCLTTLTLSTLTGFQFCNDNFKFRTQWLPTFFIHVLLFSFGLLVVYMTDERNKDDYFIKHLQQHEALLLKINEEPTMKNKAINFTAEVIATIDSFKQIPLSGKIKVTISKKENQQIPNAGDIILMDRIPQPIRNTSNPGGFDFASYQALQQVYFSVFLYPDQYRIVGHKPLPVWKSFISSMKTNTLQLLEKYIGDDTEVVGIAEALLIGYKANLDQQLNQSYSDTGVVHIIAISGLHLGLIYASLVWIFGWLPWLNRNAIARGLILLMSLWTFTLLSGASASVLRSAVMFSCIVLGEIIGRRASIYNALAASAFLLLCIHPTFLFDIGFQLSYLAIIGIVWLQQPIQSIWKPSSFILKKIWEMCSITIAAQLIAFPICLYYFHQFPNYFLPANLIAVPLSTIILFAEIILLIFSPLSVFANWIGKCCHWLIELLNLMIRFIADLPMASIRHLQISWFGTILFYLMIIFILSFFIYKNRLLFLAFMSCALLFSITVVTGAIQAKKQTMLVVYNIKGSCAVDVIQGQHSYLFMDSSLIIRDGLNNQAVTTSHDYFHVTRPTKMLQAINYQLHKIDVNNKHIIILDGKYLEKTTHFNQTADILVLSHAENVDFYELKNSFHPRMIVLDGTHPMWKIEDLRRKIEAVHLQCFSVTQQGAYVLQLS